MKSLRPIRVLLLLQRPEAWVNLVSLWDFLSKKEDFEPELWVLPYNVENKFISDAKAPLMRKLLNDASIPFYEWVEGTMLPENYFDIAIINHPYDRERPVALWANKIKATIPCMIYIPYGPVMAGGYKNMRLQFSQATQVLATAIIARSCFEKNLYAQYCKAGDKHVYVLGQPRFDQVLNALSEPVSQTLKKEIAERVTVLWNSHFSFGLSHSQSSNFSTFDLVGPEIFELAIKRREKLCLIWRPHPGLFSSLVKERLLNNSDIPVLRSELIKVGIILDEEPDHISSFKISDALLTDVGSFLLEYLVTGKPILALLNPEGEPLNTESTRLIQHYFQASTYQEVKTFIDLLEAGEAQVYDLAAAQHQHIPLLDGLAAERVAKLIMDIHDGKAVDVKIADELITPCNAPACSKRKAILISDESENDIDIPPTLSRLISALRDLREKKMKEPVWRKKARRMFNGMRTFFTEFAKNNLFLMLLARKLRR